MLREEGGKLREEEGGGVVGTGGRKKREGELGPGRAPLWWPAAVQTPHIRTQPKKGREDERGGGERRSGDVDDK